MHKIKATGISLIILMLFWLLLEAGARIALCVATGSAKFLRYGFHQQEKDENRFEKVFDTQNNVMFFTCTQSTLKNPVNSLGLRGTQIEEKKPGTLRVICLGGSTTYGLSLDYADSYPKILQDKLDALCERGHYEVINAGVPAHQLPHIINQVQHIIAPLHPDIVIVMSVFNNLVTDERDFAFIEIQGEEKSRAQKFIREIITAAKKHSVLVMVTDDIVKKGRRDLLRNLDWEKGAAAIMRSHNVWNKISENLQTLFVMLKSINPDIKIFVLDEPMNIIDYPMLSAPMEKAYQMQKEVCSRFPETKHLALMPLFHEAQKAGKKIWFAPYHDPIHLSREGNELLADILVKEILTSLNHKNCKRVSHEQMDE